MLALAQLSKLVFSVELMHIPVQLCGFLHLVADLSGPGQVSALDFIAGMIIKLVELVRPQVLSLPFSPPLILKSNRADTCNCGCSLSRPHLIQLSNLKPVDVEDFKKGIARYRNEIRVYHKRMIQIHPDLSEIRAKIQHWGVLYVEYH
jgi:hypothetical protein